jgi:hypothetical protein
LRILFSVRNPTYVRHYESVLRALAARGHGVRLVMQPGKRSWPASVLTLARECPAIQLSTMPEVALDPWWELASRFRQSRHYLRFLRPEFRGTPELLARARTRAPRPAVRLGEWIGKRDRARRLIVHLLSLLEQSTRSAALFHQYVRHHQPDVLVTTPLVVLKTAQLDLARAATELGVRNVFAVASWDHLSSKSELTFSPQQVFVWNEIQKQEVVEWHHVTADRVVVTGSQVFDDWFDRPPSTTRAEFCARVGLPPDRPILLYACSSLLEGSAPEPPFVVRWARHLRASEHTVLRECGILVRPHFRRRREWRGVDLGGLGSIACWPSEGDAPADAGAKADYFDSLFHAHAIVGVNTSAMIEAAIVGRPVHTVLLPEFTHSQEGTLHFHYLLKGTEGVLRATRSLDEHADDLAAVLEGRGVDPDRSARFVRTFVRPRGLNIPATTRFVEALEQLAALPPPAPVAAPPWAHLIRPVLWPFAHAASARARRSRDSFRHHKQRLLTEHRRRRAADRTTSAQHRP